MASLPKTQRAIQLTGPDKLTFNEQKAVHPPGPYQILCRVEAVGLCSSDLKLLKQFSAHARKSEIISGIDTATLKEIPSYVPNQKPAVPGHEAVIRIEAVGNRVEKFAPGQRCLVQTDYRWLPTTDSNASFGYNFEGGLQEYVLMDQRIIISPQGESMLIPVNEDTSASAIALVEPWACVENAYASKERQGLKKDGNLLIAADGENNIETALLDLLAKHDKPARITLLSKNNVPIDMDLPTTKAKDLSELTDAGYDDVIYFGSCPETAGQLFAKIAPSGIFNIVLSGRRFDSDVTCTIGRVHYGGIRIIGTTSCRAADSYKYIPETGEIRIGNKINTIGASGPMGVMHVIRNICSGIEAISIFASARNDKRLAALTAIAEPLAKKNLVNYTPYNPTKEKIEQLFDYTAIMAPVADLVAASVKNSAKRGIINIFAGIPASVSVAIDFDTYIEKELFFIGTSGSVLEDMKKVLSKVRSGSLDTNVSVAAICGLEHATEGLRAVEDRAIAGKIVVYPSCKGLQLIPLEKLSAAMPAVAECLNNGQWTKQAEEELLEKYR